MNVKMRRDALRRYLVFRVKMIEFFDIASLRQSLTRQQFTVPELPFRRTSDFTESLRTPLLSWLALLIDRSKGGMNAIQLWSELFPRHKPEIEQMWVRIEGAWNIIRRFRDKAGFHGDTAVAFFKARHDVTVHKDAVIAAVEDFHKLLKIILEAEDEELPDFEEVVDEFLDELEVNVRGAYNRDEFKRYLILN